MRDKTAATALLLGLDWADPETEAGALREPEMALAELQHEFELDREQAECAAGDREFALALETIGALLTAQRREVLASAEPRDPPC
jgi:hypothetical protein